MDDDEYEKKVKARMESDPGFRDAVHARQKELATYASEVNNQNEGLLTTQTLAVSTVMLGASLSFVDGIVPIASATIVGALVAAWAFLALAIVIVFVGLGSSVLLGDKAAEQYRDLTTRKSPVLRALQLITKWTNFLAILLLICGVIGLAVFAGANAMAGKVEHATLAA